MRIISDPSGKILAWGNDKFLDGELFAGPLPDDFSTRAPIGKYKFIAGEIVLNPDFVEPELASEPPSLSPMSIPSHP